MESSDASEKMRGELFIIEGKVNSLWSAVSKSFYSDAEAHAIYEESLMDAEELVGVSLINASLKQRIEIANRMHATFMKINRGVKNEH